MTDARFSGGSVGGAPIIGHIDEDGNIRFIENGDTIIIHPRKNYMQLDISDEVLKERQKNREKQASNIHTSDEIHIPLPLRTYAL